MAKIESIRPGGIFEGNFRDYPFADLLLGVLRGNLTGSLDVRLAQEPRNHVFFKDGVPVSVMLPDLGVSVAKILTDTGEIPRDRAVDIVRAAEKLHMSESKVIIESEILTQGAIHDARRKRAREQVVRLFDAGPTSFSFVEGRMIPDDAALTILQPLPIVFEGLRRSRDRTVIDRFLDEYATAQFKLSATYPHGVDPFEWGRDVEAVITQMGEPKSIGDLLDLGLEKKLAEVALAVMFFSGMVELARGGVPRERRPTLEHVTPSGEPMPMPSSRTPGRGVRIMDPRSGGSTAASADESADRDPSGLVIHRRAQPVLPDRGPGQVPTSTTDPIPVVDRVSMAMHSFRGKSYYKILRVTETTAADQVERSYRHLVRQAEEQDDAMVRTALIGILNEAHSVLADRESGPRYRDIFERAKTSSAALSERQGFEAERKVTRCLSAMAEGRMHEAVALLDWIATLDPGRRDLKVLRGVYNYFRAPRDRRALEARTLKPLVISEMTRSPGDGNLKMCVALLSAEEGEQFEVAAEHSAHPIMDRVRDLLRSR